MAIALLPGLMAAGGAKADDIRVPPALEKVMPESIQDLQAIEAHVKTVVAKVMPAVVNVKPQNGSGQGSGVVITEDGYVLTAAHVIPTPDKVYTITFPDGKQVKAKSLGSLEKPDSGLLKITDEGKYAFCEMGISSQLKKGQWCIAIGHPGGFKSGRTPPVRLGRVVSPPGAWITTEAILVAGDSGGPLFDMYGKVIGIHSRIGGPLTANMHVPVDVYRTDWDKMTNPARLGVVADPDLEGKGIKVATVVAGSPAEKAGLKVDDVITTINAKSVANIGELRAEIQKRKVGDEVTLEVRRGAETLRLEVVLDKAIQ